jgi:hypothetical protein
LTQLDNCPFGELGIRAQAQAPQALRAGIPAENDLVMSAEFHPQGFGDAFADPVQIRVLGLIMKLKNQNRRTLTQARE